LADSAARVLPVALDRVQRQVGLLGVGSLQIHFVDEPQLTSMSDPHKS
jgi:hypothetical protein